MKKTQTQQIIIQHFFDRNIKNNIEKVSTIEEGKEYLERIAERNKAHIDARKNVIERVKQSSDKTEALITKIQATNNAQELLTILESELDGVSPYDAKVIFTALCCSEELKELGEVGNELKQILEELSEFTIQLCEIKNHYGKPLLNTSLTTLEDWFNGHKDLKNELLKEADLKLVENAKTIERLSKEVKKIENEILDLNINFNNLVIGFDKIYTEVIGGGSPIEKDIERESKEDVVEEAIVYIGDNKIKIKWDSNNRFIFNVEKVENEERI